MTIYGVSQSSGVERRLKIERGGQGVVLTIIEHVGDKERERIMVSPDDILVVITDPPSEVATLEGVCPPHGAKMALDIQVKRNEVLLKTHDGSGNGTDVAVGFDDFQDALEGAISRA